MMMKKMKITLTAAIKLNVLRLPDHLRNPSFFKIFKIKARKASFSKSGDQLVGDVTASPEITRIIYKKIPRKKNHV